MTALRTLVAFLFLPFLVLASAGAEEEQKKPTLEYYYLDG